MASSTHLESKKYVFESLKHMTTLASGSVLVATAVVEKLFPNAPSRLPVIIAMVAFVATVLAGLIGMTVLAVSMKTETVGGIEANVFAGSCVLAAVSFAIGIIAIAYFILVNSM